MLGSLLAIIVHLEVFPNLAVRMAFLGFVPILGDLWE